MIARAQPRILAYLNISFAGICGFSSTVSVGEAQDMRLMAVREAVKAARDNPALDASDRAGLPLMCHIDEAPSTYSEPPFACARVAC